MVSVYDIYPSPSENSFNPDGANARSIPVDARIALVLLFVYSVGIFFVESWWGIGLFAALCVASLTLWKPGIKKILITLVPLYFILLFTVVAHLPQGLSSGLFYAVRILLLAVITMVIAFSYDDTRLVRAFTSLLSPLRAFRVPVDDLATMFSIALRFIPTSLDEIQRVRTAQISRCARFDEGTISVKVKRWSHVLVPVIVGMFRRADALACAMDARCYSGARRTSLHRDALRFLDFVIAAVGIAACALGAILL